MYIRWLEPRISYDMSDWPPMDYNGLLGIALNDSILDVARIEKDGEIQSGNLEADVGGR